MNAGMIKMLLQSVDLDEVNNIITQNSDTIIKEVDNELFKGIELKEDEEQAAVLYLKKGTETFGMVITLPKDFFDSETNTIKVKRLLQKNSKNIKSLISKIKIKPLIDKLLN
jgi:hypothetical protein